MVRILASYSEDVSTVVTSRLSGPFAGKEPALFEGEHLRMQEDECALGLTRKQVSEQRQ